MYFVSEVRWDKGACAGDMASVSWLVPPTPLPISTSGPHSVFLPQTHSPTMAVFGACKDPGHRHRTGEGRSGKHDPQCLREEHGSNHSHPGLAASWHMVGDRPEATSQWDKTPIQILNKSWNGRLKHLGVAYLPRVGAVTCGKQWPGLTSPDPTPILGAMPQASI